MLSSEEGWKPTLLTKLKMPVAPKARVTAPLRLSVLAKSALRIVETVASRARKLTGMTPVPTEIAAVEPALSRPKTAPAMMVFWPAEPMLMALVPPKVGAALVIAFGVSSSAPDCTVVGPVWLKLPKTFRT